MVRKVVEQFSVYYYNEKNEFHREDGPALEFTNGNKYWYINGLKHRIDGPAAQNDSIGKVYYIMGKEYSYEDWLAIKDYPLLW